MSDEFHSDLFVGRETELEELRAWAVNSAAARRLVTIAAPPGYGKSWLIQQLQARLARRNDLCFIYLSPPDLKPNNIFNLNGWPPPVIHKVQTMYPHVRPYDPEAPLSQIIAHLTEDLCQNVDPPVLPLLIIDDFDLLLDRERKTLEKQVLEQFWYNAGVKIMVAMRDEFSLTSPALRRGERRIQLAVFTPSLGQEQLQKRADFDKESPLPHSELLGLIPPYNWTHPRINSRLYQILRTQKQNQNPPLLTANDLKKCWWEQLEEHISVAGLSQSTIEKDLRALVCCDEKESLSLQEFAQKEDYSISTASAHIQTLIELSLVSADKHKYKVVDGIRELIRAEISLLGEEESS